MMKPRVLGIQVMLAVMVLCPPRTAWSELIVYEGFDYDPAQISGLGDASDGWGSSWGTYADNGTFGDADYPQVVDSGLQYTDSSGNTLITAGNKLQPGFETYGNAIRRIDVNSDGKAAQAGLVAADSNRLGSVDGTSMWMSFLATGSESEWAGVSLYDGSNAQSAERVFLGKPINELNWGLIRKNDLVSVSTVSGNDPVFLVARIDFNDGLEDIHLWLNPDLLGEPADDAADVTVTVNDFQFDRLRLAGSTAFALDEVRLGTSYPDVSPVPEPASLVLFAVLFPAMLWCLHRRRRRH